MRFIRLDFDSLRGDPRYARWAPRAGQPAWVWRIAASAAAMVIVIPVILLFLAATATFVIVFVVLSLACRIGNVLRRLTGARSESGRRNVRVIRVER